MVNETDIIKPMTKDEAVEWENQVGSTANRLRQLLAEGYERQAWRVLGYGSWSEHLRVLADRFGFSERRIEQLHSANLIERELFTEHCSVDDSYTQVGQIPEGHLRPLSRLDTPDQKREVWQLAQETAPNGKMTGAHVESVVKNYLEDSFESVDDEPAQTFDYKRDNKTNRQGDIYTPMGYDACQTPPEALDPLLPFIPETFKTVWEPAQGERLLVEALYDSFLNVIGSDILDGQNFFEWQPDEDWDCIITNPPYSIKYEWLKRCYELGKPFALLMPTEMLSTKTAGVLFVEYGIELVVMTRRVNFKMPNKGWDGKGSQFPTMWFTYGFKIGNPLNFVVN